jgi:hypothetical protein
VPQRIDRIQLVVTSTKEVARAWTRLLGAQPLREDASEALGARCVALALGESEVELLEPEGSGPAADFLARAGGGLFAAGIAVHDVAALRARLEAQGVAVVAEHGQLLLAPEALGIPGLRLVVSSLAARERVGMARFLYEVTHLCDDAAAATARFATLFGLDTRHFVPIRSSEFGYEGTLTLFSPDRLDRLEIIHPFEATKTMGRFFARRGPSLYMAYAESGETAAVRARAVEQASHDWTGSPDATVPDNLFLHPRALGGVMLGVSRTSYAWTWSGRPERVTPAPS